MSWNRGIAFLIMGIATSAFANPESIRLGYDDYCPYACLKSEQNGYVVDAIRHILEANGYKVIAVKGSWARLKTMAQKGQLELAVPLTRFETEELKLDRNSMPLGRIEGRLFTHKSSTWIYKDAASLKGQTMAIVRDYGYPPLITDLMDDPKQKKNFLILASDDSTSQQVKMLANRRVNVVPADRHVFLYHARRLGVEDSIKVAGEVPMENLYTDLHIGIATTQPELRKKLRMALDKGIEELKKNGGLVRMKAKYGVVD